MQRPAIDFEDKENVNYHITSRRLESILPPAHCAIEGCRYCKPEAHAESQFRPCSTIAEVTEPSESSMGIEGVKALWVGSSECVANNTRGKTQVNRIY